LPQWNYIEKPELQAIESIILSKNAKTRLIFRTLS